MPLFPHQPGEVRGPYRLAVEDWECGGGVGVEPHSVIKEGFWSHGSACPSPRLPEATA